FCWRRINESAARWSGGSSSTRVMFSTGMWLAARCVAWSPRGRDLGYRGAAMAIPTAEQLNGHLVGFDRLYGLELLEVSDEQVRARTRVRDELKQAAGLVHGGVYASIAESLASMATALAVMDRGEMAMGMANSTSFL